jgi:hypothetical protein
MRYSSIDRFDNYRTIEARFDSLGSCGHQIRRGDQIGYNPRNKRTQCPACWARWTAENREADALEFCGSDCAYDY